MKEQKCIAEAIKFSTKVPLLSLSLSNYEIGKARTARLLGALHKNCRVTHIDISGNDIEDVLIVEIAHALDKNIRINKEAHNLSAVKASTTAYPLIIPRKPVEPIPPLAVL